jgi:hypothetical protein
MIRLFDAFKQYIVNHPKVTAYKPTSGKYDGGKLRKIRGLFDPFLIKGLKYPVRNKSH